MKNYIYIPLVALAALLLLQACYKDLGNYDYQDIDEVTITFDKEEYETMTGRITIEPTLVSTVHGTIDAGNEDLYTYAWLVGRGGRIDTIARARQLQDHEFIGLAGTNFVYYRVTNKSTGVFSDAQITLKVVNTTSQGYMLLCDDNGKARLDMASWYNNQFHPHYNLLSDVLPEQTGPFKIITYADGQLNNYGLASPGGRAIYILSQSGTERVGYDAGTGLFTYKPEYNVQYQFSPGTCPPGFIADNLNTIGTFPMISGKGDLYYCNPSSSLLWGTAVNTLDGGVNYFPAASQYAGISGQAWMVFDNDSKSLYQLASTSSMCSKISTTNEVIIPYTNIGKDVVYMDANNAVWLGHGNLNDMKYYAILKDPGTGKYWLLRAAYTRLQEYWKEMDATDIDKASCFAVGGLYNLEVYYAVGGKVYKYNIADNKSYLVIDKGAANITYIGFGNHSLFNFGPEGANMYDPFFKYMVVASYDGTTGTVGCYNVEPGINMWSLYKHPTTSESFEWTGFGKIVSIAWKP